MALGPQKVQIRRTATPNNPPVGLSEGELSVEMANPLRLWVGVPTSIDATGKRLLTSPFVVAQDTPPTTPGQNQLWWETDTGILWLWYNDGTSSQWVQVSSSGGKVEEIATGADEIAFQPGGGLSADDVQEALMELDGEKLAKAGGTMTGVLTLIAANPTAATDAAHKGYVDGQISTLSTTVGTKIGEAPQDGNTYGRRNATWVALTGAASVPIAYPFSGKPGTSARINVPVGILSVIPASLTGSLAYASVAATADATFTVNKVSGGSTTALGTIVMKASGTHTFAGAGGSLAVGDILQLVAPATQDTTLADVGITIMTQRG
jgi:hypothetical protein